jgi:2-methylcitrate dehydratase PrpD
MDPDGSRAAAIVGTRQRTTAGQAALANGIAAHMLDFDDTFNPDRTTIHGSAPLWPAIAAAGELVPVSGKLAVDRQLRQSLGLRRRTRRHTKDLRQVCRHAWHVHRHRRQLSTRRG